VLSQGPAPHIFINPLLHAIRAFCLEKASKNLKSAQNNRTVGLPIPGRQLMVMLADLSGLKVVLGHNNVLSVTLNEVSCLDSLTGCSVSRYDFRADGFGVVYLHGFVTFKWEMIVSEEGHGPIEGRLTMTVGGWSVTDRMDHDPIKQCYDPHLLKKRRTSQPASVDAAAGIGAGASRSNSLLSAPKDSEQRSPLRGKENVVPSNTSEVNSGRFLAEAIQKSVEEDNVPDRLDNIFPVEGEDGQGSLQLSLGEAQPAAPIAQGQTGMELLSAASPIEAQ
jgi:hypothetical protein